MPGSSSNPLHAPIRSRRWSRRPTCRRAGDFSTRCTSGWRRCPSSATCRSTIGPPSSNSASLPIPERHGRPARPRRDLGGQEGRAGARLRRIAVPGRQAAYVAFREEHGEGLVDFATWCALAERHGCRGGLGRRSCARPGAGGRPCGAGRAGGLLRLAPVGRRRSAGAHARAGPVCRHAARCRPRFGRRRVHEGGRRVGSAARSRVGRHGRRTRRRLQPAGPGLEAAALASAASPRRATSRTATWSGPSCVTPADCASTTWSDCSACGGFRRGLLRRTEHMCGTTMRRSSGSSPWRRIAPGR